MFFFQNESCACQTDSVYDLLSLIFGCNRNCKDIIWKRVEPPLPKSRKGFSAFFVLEVWFYLTPPPCLTSYFNIHLYPLNHLKDKTIIIVSEHLFISGHNGN